MESITLSSVQAKAIKSVPKYGQVNYKALGIKKNTLLSLVKYGLVNIIEGDYIRRSV